MTETTWTPATIALSKLKPWERNPKRISKAHAARLLDLWERLGQFQTIAIGPDGEVYDGHQRLSVLKAKHGGSYQVQVLQASRPLTEAEREELTIAAHSGTTGSWDWDALAGWDVGNLTAWGLDEELLSDWNAGATALREMLAAETAPTGEDPGPQVDKASELQAKWQTATGQMWQLGEHRLICGDCTDAEVVARVLQGEKPRLMVTDPPYGIEHDTSWREEAGISGMGEQSAKCIEWDSNDNWSTAYLASGADVAFVWHASSHNIIVAQSLVDAGYEVKQMIIWNKTVAPFGRSHYSYKHEPCWYAVKKGKTANWHGPNNEVTVWDAASPRHIMGGSNEGKTPHPTQKPILLYERPITNHTQVGDVVYEPFSGSGTAIIACEQLGRKCRAVEISPGYVAVALERWATMTGKTPVLVDGAS